MGALAAIRLTQSVTDRSRGLGSSDAPTALGLNPYATRCELFDEKIGIVEPADLSDNEAVEMGNLLEGPVATVYERRTGLKLHRIHATLQHPRYPWMLANFDRSVVGAKPPKVVEIKTKGIFAFAAGGWSDPDEDATGVPEVEMAQVQHQLAVDARYASADVAVLIGGQKVKIYRDIPRDETYIEALIAIEGDLWDRIEKGRAILDRIAETEYETTGVRLAQFIREGHAAESFVARIEDELRALRPDPANYDEAKRRFPKHLELPIAATDDIAGKFALYRALKAEEKARNDQLDALQNDLACFMGDYDTLVVNGAPALTWRSQSSDRFEIKAHAADCPDCHARFIKPSPTRVMRIASGSAKKGKK